MLLVTAGLEAGCGLGMEAGTARCGYFGNWEAEQEPTFTGIGSSVVEGYLDI